MAINLLPSEEYYEISEDKYSPTELNTLQVVKDYLREKTPVDSKQLRKIYQDVEKFRNFVCYLDDYKSVERNGVEGERVAYGAFSHSALEHSTQTVWSYTYEILDVGDGYYMTINTWGWLPDTDLRRKVDQLL